MRRSNLGALNFGKCERNTSAARAIQGLAWFFTQAARMTAAGGLAEVAKHAGQAKADDNVDHRKEAGGQRGTDLEGSEQAAGRAGLVFVVLPKEEGDRRLEELLGETCWGSRALRQRRRQEDEFGVYKMAR